MDRALAPNVILIFFVLLGTSVQSVRGETVYRGSCDFINTFFGQRDSLLESLVGSCPEPTQGAAESAMFLMGVACASSVAAAGCLEAEGRCEPAGAPAVSITEGPEGMPLCRYQVTYRRGGDGIHREPKIERKSWREVMKQYHQELEQKQLKREQWLQEWLNNRDSMDRKRCPLDGDHVGMQAASEVINRFEPYLRARNTDLGQAEIRRLMADECNVRLLRAMRFHVFRADDS